MNFGQFNFGDKVKVKFPKNVIPGNKYYVGKITGKRFTLFQRKNGKEDKVEIEYWVKGEWRKEKELTLIKRFWE